ncbi:MAG TPA: L,D-transpeptidase family protein, partial [Candidatus Paceibacterota bacterium]|nr:L,D-transpeptidase family protein [Candidatus Paceibacterota bacterium]
IWLLTGAICVLLAVSVFLYNSKTLSYNFELPGSANANSVTLSYGEHPALSNPDFFAQVKERFIEEKSDFIEADLSAMLVRVYRQGQVVVEVPVKTKGREGSWWETPAGLYKIESKEKNHFSSIGHVNQPWSMRFQGNFYIHGWPYYPDGTPVSSQFSGGCVRLDTEDAQKIYDAVEVGTPVLVFEDDFDSDTFEYKKNLPQMTAPVFLAADLRNNHVFSSQNSTQEVPIASITKLMTALVATEYINLEAEVTITKSSIASTSKPRLFEGQKTTVYQLLFPLLMESSNEAALAIANHYGKASFIKHMNEKALSIGMKNTRFVDPSGASPENISTADDLFMLAKYIYNNRSFIFKITSGQLKDSVYGASNFTGLSNFNDYVDNKWFIGGKVGQTKAAGETSLSVFEFPVGTEKRPVVLIFLGSLSRVADAEALLKHTLEHIRE